MINLKNDSKIVAPLGIYRSEEDRFEQNAAAEELFQKKEELEMVRGLLREMLRVPETCRRYAEVISAGDAEYLLLSQPAEEQGDFLVFSLDMSAVNPVLRQTGEVRKIEQEYCDILGSIHADIVIIDRDGYIRTVLPNFETMYGISAEEAVGKTIFEMEERKIFNPSIAALALKSGRSETMLQKTGAEKYLMCTATPVYDGEGRLEKIVSFTRDVTDYESLRSQYDDLQKTLDQYSVQLEQLRSEQKMDDSLVGNSPEITHVTKMIEKIAQFDATVLLTGESGVGKTMYASLIHRRSGRKDKAFISINCGAIPENLLESELFGYEKGAFTGAGQTGKAGLVELADGGTLFLDEIGDLPLHMQVKLLKVIQEKKSMRVGGTVEKEIDFRLIAATNKNMKELLETGQFREDLFYRLNVISIHIPPLRERKADIFPLLNFFLNKYSERYGVKKIFAGKAVDYLEQYGWPGNIRELENMVERLVLTADDYMIGVDMLPQYVSSNELVFDSDMEGKTLKELLEEVEKKIFVSTYKKCGTTTQVARLLGISQASASMKISKYIKNQITKN
ncbi:sigma-54 interaction domain-containing protein [Bacilliculturomica massiliensis]|uniref:sigma-54 interaction domain-containing protein n=1 Tax=Bacilliculturomica massiliensis TaxID=1917867 RepID=UPI0010301171|nr:sigma 54-interacting transcriptional regulator [Bacilliculturomica massiliensis]